MMSKYRYQYWVMEGSQFSGPDEWAVYMEMTEQTGSDGGLAAALMDLGAHLVSRICFCNCGNAFYRRFEHQQYCSEACRLAFYTTSAKWKKYRRDKAREYYWVHKRGVVKSYGMTKVPR